MAASNRHAARRRFAVLAFDDLSVFHLAVPTAVFADAAPPDLGLELQVCAERPGPVRLAQGMALQVGVGLEALGRADVVVVPSWPVPVDPAQPVAVSPRLRRALRAAHRRGAVIVGLCLGAWLLAEVGLLDGRRGTTHWAHADDFARRYPNVAVDADVLFIDDGDVVTSAGTGAGIDCCLHLLRRWHGAPAANHTARMLVLPPHRDGGQAQFIERPVPERQADARLTALLEEVRRHLDRSHPLDALAARLGTSRRTFSRRFRAATGTSLAAWLQAERVALARRLLERGRLDIEAVAQAAGFGSAALLRHHFRRQVGVAPTQWRRRFGEVAG